jgi:hypothetical protein
MRLMLGLHSFHPLVKRIDLLGGLLLDAVDDRFAIRKKSFRVDESLSLDDKLFERVRIVGKFVNFEHEACCKPSRPIAPVQNLEARKVFQAA